MKRIKDNVKNMLQIKGYTNSSVDIHIYGDIVSDSQSMESYEDIFPGYFKDFIDAANGREINVYINSGGGNVMAGVAIATMLKRYEGKTTAHIDGICGSIATVIALACDEVNIPSNGFFMIHQSRISTRVSGIAKDIIEKAQATAQVLERANEAMLRTYEENMAEGADFQVIKNYIDSGKDKWFTGSEAVSFFNMQLLESNEAVAYIESDYFKKDTMPEALKSKVDEWQFETLQF